jgi:hypothetical protein
LAKKVPILKHFSIFRGYIQNTTTINSDEKRSDIFEANSQQLNGFGDKVFFCLVQ